MCCLLFAAARGKPQPREAWNLLCVCCLCCCHAQVVFPAEAASAVACSTVPDGESAAGAACFLRCRAGAAVRFSAAAVCDSNKSCRIQLHREYTVPAYVYLECAVNLCRFFPVLAAVHQQAVRQEAPFCAGAAFPLFISCCACQCLCVQAALRTDVRVFQIE